MFQEIINKLTKEQMQRLKELGVPHTRVSEWRHGKGLPSRRAVLALAEVTGADAMTIESEVMALELKPDERATFSRVLKIPAGVLSVAFLTMGMMGAPRDANADQGSRPLPRGQHSLYIVNSMLRRLVDWMQEIRQAKTVTA